jgi:hypothetical protein
MLRLRRRGPAALTGKAARFERRKAVSGNAGIAFRPGKTGFRGARRFTAR